MTKVKTKKRISLSIKLVAVTIIAILVATGFYFEVDNVVNDFIDKRYFSEKAVTQREARRLKDFRAFVKSKNVKSTDSEMLKEWAVDEGYVYLSIYKDNQVLFDSGWWNDEATVNEYDASKVQEDSEDFYEDCPTVKMGDGKFQIMITDYSEIPLYYISNIAIFFVSALIVLLIILFFFKRTTKRINVLSSEVESIKTDINADISYKSNDELTELSHDVDDMRNTIIEQLSAKQQAWQANSDLVTSMAHDLRTPLTVLSGFLDLIKEKRFENETQMEEYIKISADKVQEIKELSDKLFQYFFVYSNSELEYFFEEFSADELLLQIINESVFLLRDYGFSFSKITVPQGLLVRTDVKHLKRIFDNIFSNLNKYANKEETINIQVSKNDKFLKVKFENEISSSRNSAESTCIGLKSCEKIAQGLGCEFSAIENDATFTTVIAIPFYLKKED